MFTENIDDLYKKKNDLFSFINQYCKFFGKDTLIDLSKLLYEDHNTKEISYMEHNIIGPYFNNQECKLYVKYNMGQVHMLFTTTFIVAKGITADAQDVINTLQFYINNKYVYGTMSTMDPIKDRVKQIISHMEEEAKEKLYKFLQHYFHGEKFYRGSTISYRYTFGIHLDFTVEYLCNISSIPQFRIFISEKNPMYNPYNTLFQHPYPIYNGFGAYYHNLMPYYGGSLPNEIKSITLSIVDLYEMIHNNTNYEVEENKEEDKEEEKEEYRDMSGSIHKKRVELEEKELKINRAKLFKILLYADNEEEIRNIKDKVHNNMDINALIRSMDINYKVHFGFHSDLDKYYVSAYNKDDNDNKLYGFYIDQYDLNNIFRILFKSSGSGDYDLITMVEFIFDSTEFDVKSCKYFFDILKSALHQDNISERTLHSFIGNFRLDIIDNSGFKDNDYKRLILYTKIGYHQNILKSFTVNTKNIDQDLDLIYYMHFTDEE